jgi:MerR family transcriptional regulator, light-induced transcriptional regulator
MTTDTPETQPPSGESDHGGAITIGELSRRTGLSPATIRMWETRHGFPRPQRLESGHRRYTLDDVRAVQQVVQHKDAGVRLELAIVRALADAEPATPSIYAQLRRRHPHLGVHRLRKTTLLALSWAIEDEFCAKADRAAIFGAFQRDVFYRSAQPRWAELARVASSATVFGDFETSDNDAAPQEVSLPADAPMRREWAVVCDAPDLPVVLTAWELPGQADVPDGARLFESMWSIDGQAVRDAARVCTEVARDAGVTVPSAPEPREPALPDLNAVTGLFNRMVAYVDQLGS